MWKTLVGKFQPLPAAPYTDPQNEQDLESFWRDTTGGTVISENAASQAELTQYVYSTTFSSLLLYVSSQQGCLSKGQHASCECMYGAQTYSRT